MTRMVGDSITQQVRPRLAHRLEKIGKPLVVEDATPMITNGVTAQALKLIFYGQGRRSFRLVEPFLRSVSTGTATRGPG
jgi:hypothetical protein